MTATVLKDAMSDADFDRIAALALSEAGIELPRNKSAMIQSRVFRHMRKQGFTEGLSRFIDLIIADEARRSELVSVLTTNVTGFFREPHHFDTLRAFLKARAPSKTDRIRIWSAGCSAGHEPYSIAMTCHELWPDIATRDVRILATDIDHDILKLAREGVYSRSDVDKVGKARLERYFEPVAPDDPTRLRVSAEIGAIISFRPLNLHAEWPMRGVFDAIFCRNVVIYFSDEGRAQLWPRFRDILLPGGHLFIGHSERIHPLRDSGFEAAGITTFRRIAA